MAFLRIIFALYCVATIAHGFSTQKSQTCRSLRVNGVFMSATDSNKIMKKVLLPILLSSALLIGTPMTSNAFWNESGEWVELKESSVTEVWGDRLKKASTMKPSDIFMAAKGAGNNDKRIGPESAASKKRRAMAGCRTTEYRSLVPGGISELNCNIKVNKGDSQFMLDILDPPK